MSNFSGRHNPLMMNMNMNNSIFLLLLLSLSLGLMSLIQASSGEEDQGHGQGHGHGQNGNLQEYLWSREEFVQLAGYGEEKLSTVIVTGTLLCHACSSSHAQPQPQPQPQLRSWPIPDALVAVKCNTNGKWEKLTPAQAITDQNGDFLIDLPSHLHAIPNMEEACSVKVLRLPKKAVCQPSLVRKQSAITLSSVGNGIRNYSAGTIKIMHLTSKPLQACIKGGAAVTAFELQFHFIGRKVSTCEEDSNEVPHACK